MRPFKKRTEVIEHSFNVKIAMEVGALKAILLKNFMYWLNYNEIHRMNYRDGKYWTYATSEAYAEAHPYMPPSSIRRWLIELEKDGWLLSGNYNKFKIDKTKWYTYGPKLKDFLEEKTSDSLKIYDAHNEQHSVQVDQQSAQIEQSLFAQNEQAIPNTALNTNTVQVSKHIKKQLMKHFKKLDGLEDLTSILSQVPGVREAIKIFDIAVSELSIDEKYKFKYNVGMLEEIIKRKVQEHKHVKIITTPQPFDHALLVTGTIMIVNRNVELHRDKFSEKEIKQIEQLIAEGKHLQAQNKVAEILGNEFITAA